MVDAEEDDLVLETTRAAADSDVDVLDIYRVGGVGALVAGAWTGYIAGRDDRLTTTWRRRGVAGGAAIAALGAAGLRDPRRFAAVLRGPAAPLLPTVGLIGTALSGPRDSPLFLPTVFLTALGAGRAGASSGAALGAVTGLAYLGVVAADAVRSGVDRDAWWNVAMSAAFWGAGATGGVLGDAALTVRALEARRTREQAVLDAPGAGSRLRERADRIGEQAADIDRRLLAIASQAGSEALEPEQLRRAVDRNRAQVHHLTVAPLLVDGAMGARVDLLSVLDRLCQVYRTEAVDPAAQLRVDLTEAHGSSTDSRRTSVLLQVAKRSLDNALADRAGRRATLVQVALARRGDTLVLTVEDDGGGTAPHRSVHGTGLSEPQAQCRGVGGDLELQQGSDGVRVVATVPTTDAPPPTAVLGRLDRKVTAAVDEILSNLRRATVVQGLGSLLVTPDRRARVSSIASFGLLAAAWEAAPRRLRITPAAEAAVAAALGIWPTGGKPADGWAAVVLAETALRRRAAPTIGAGVVVGAARAAIGRHRRPLPVGTQREKTAFPLVGAVLGATFSALQRHLEGIERDLISTADRLELLERIARPVRAEHDLLKPIRDLPQEWLRLLETPQGQELADLSDACRKEATAFAELLIEDDPVAVWFAQLEHRLHPATVSLRARLPHMGAHRLDDQVLRRARSSLSIVLLADELADLLLATHPPDALGRWPMRSARVELTPATAPERLEVTVAATARRQRGRRRDASGLAAVLASIDGELLEGLDDGTVRFTVPTDVFART